MKRLMAMIGAVAMSFGLFAADPFAISYEANETAAGVSEGTWTPGTKWSWDGEVIPVITDDARVLPYGAEGTSKARREDVFLSVTGGSDNHNYADLSTGTDELTLAVDSGNVFLDQLVKFTGFEDPQTNLVSGTKIAIWMSEFENEDESTSTNLYITCGKNVDGTYEQVALQIEGTYELNTWYRLTVKSLGDIFDASAGSTARAGFLVWVNGNKATCEDAKTLLGTDAAMITDSKKTAFYNAGRLFPAFAASDVLATVGYQGIGAIDDIIVDAEGPEFCVETVDVSFNEIENAVIAKVVDGDNVEFNYPDGTIAVKPGLLTVTLEAAEGYKMFGQSVYEVNATVAGAITIDTTDKTTFEQVVATITRGADTLEFAGSELDTAISQVQDNDVVTFLAEVTFGESAYTFTKDTTITVTEGGNWAIYVADDTTSSQEMGYAVAFAGVMPEKQITVTFENDGSFIMLGGTIYGDGRVDTLVNVANGSTYVMLDNPLTVGGTLQATDGEGAILKAANIALQEGDDESAKITLAIDGKVITTTELDETAFTLPDGEYKLNIETNDVEGTDWYTYTAQEVGLIDLEFTNLPTDTAVTAVTGDTVVGDAEKGWKAEPGDELTITLTAQNGKVFDENGSTTTTVEAEASAQIDLGAAPAPFEAVAKVNDERFYNTLAAAFTAAQANDTIVLLKDVELSERIFVQNEKVTLDLAGKKIEWDTTVNNASGVLIVCRGADLTIDDSSEPSTGVIDAKGKANAAIALTHGSDPKNSQTELAAKLTVNGGSLIGTYYGIVGNGDRPNTVIVINGGLVKGTAENDCAGIYHPQAGTLTITGGTIEGATGIYAKAGDCECTVSSGATIKGVGAKAAYQPCTDGFHPTGDAIVFDNCNYPGGEPEADIAGGTFESTYAAAVASYATAGEEAIAGFVTGGSFKGQVAPDPALAGGSMAFPTFVPGEAQALVPAVASVNDVNYETSAAALLAVQALEAAKDFPIVATALVADLAVVDPVTGAEIVLAKDETITITPNSWVFSGGATITPGKPIALAAGATFTVTTQIANYKTLFRAPENYEVVEIANGDGTFTYSAAQSAAKVAKIGNVEYATLGEAIAALTGAGETIELLSDYTAADAESLVFAKDAILDLGEFELTLPAALLGAKKFEVSDGASLVLTNGVITMGDREYGLQVYGTAIVADGCTMTKLVNTKQGPIFDIYGKGTTSTDGGTVLVEAGAYIESGADVFRHKKNGAGVEAQANVYVTGGTIKTTHATYGIFNGSIYLHADDVAVITGGTFLGTFEQTEPWGSMAELGADAADVRFDTKATASAAKHLADGYEFAEAEEDGLWKIVKSPVAEIVGGDKYATLGEAIAALTGGETIKLLANYTTTENLAFNKTCTLDLNEKTLTIPADYRGKPIAASASSTAYTGVDAGATLTVTNGSVVLAEKIAGGKGNYGFYVVGKLINYANWTHDNTSGPVIELYEGAEVVQNDGVLYSGDIFRTKDGVQAEAIRTVTINGGTMTATGNNAYGYPIIYFTKSGTHNITINGGTFETAVYAYGVAGDTTNISGLDGDCQAKFKNTVITVSGAKTDLSAYVAEGYELVKGGDDYYTVQKSPVAEIVGGGKYGTLGEAIAALTGGETIKLLSDYTAADAENLVFTKNATLDLGEFELTLSAALQNNKLFKVADGASVSFENGTITMGDSAYGLQVHGTATVSCTMTKNDQTKSGPIFDIYGLGEESTNGGTVYVVNGADLQSDCDIFRHKKKAAKASVIISGGTMTATAIGDCNHQGIFFGSAYPSADDVVTITGGKFIGKFDNASEKWGNGNIKFGAEASAALFDGTAKLRMANYLADGYELVESTTETGFWQIAKIPSFTVTFSQNNEPIVGADKTVLRDTVLKAEHLPTVEGGEWDVDPVGAVITCNTNFNYTVKAGPDWPSDWPADVPETMKEAFATWAETYGVTSFEGVENAFLMNDDPKAGTATALEITSIEVADGVATIKVAAGDKNLQNGINGKLFVSATDDLAGEWKTIVVEEPKSFEDEGKTAVFEVKGAQFMKAKVDFKVEEVEKQ